MGQLPNRFPDEGQAPEYNTVDATLWYFEAIRAHHEATGDDALLPDLFPVLQDIVEWQMRGTRYQIHVDPADGLLYAGEAECSSLGSTPPHSLAVGGTPQGGRLGGHPAHRQAGRGQCAA